VIFSVSSTTPLSLWFFRALLASARAVVLFTFLILLFIFFSRSPVTHMGSLLLGPAPPYHFWMERVPDFLPFVSRFCGRWGVVTIPDLVSPNPLGRNNPSHLFCAFQFTSPSFPCVIVAAVPSLSLSFLLLSSFPVSLWRSLLCIPVDFFSTPGSITSRICHVPKLFSRFRCAGNPPFLLCPPLGCVGETFSDSFFFVSLMIVPTTLNSFSFRLVLLCFNLNSFDHPRWPFLFPTRLILFPLHLFHEDFITLATPPRYPLSFFTTRQVDVGLPGLFFFPFSPRNRPHACPFFLFPVFCSFFQQPLYQISLPHPSPFPSLCRLSSPGVCTVNIFLVCSPFLPFVRPLKLNSGCRTSSFLQTLFGCDLSWSLIGPQLSVPQPFPSHLSLFPFRVEFFLGLTSSVGHHISFPPTVATFFEYVLFLLSPP